MPILLTKPSENLVTYIFKGKEKALMTFRGKGSINKRKNNGKRISLVISFPNKKSKRPKTKKRMENPEVKKI